MFHGRSKHIKVRYHWIKDWLNERVTVIEKLHIEENVLDCLTKQVIADVFRHCLSLLNLVATRAIGDYLNGFQEVEDVVGFNYFHKVFKVRQGRDCWSSSSP